MIFLVLFSLIYCQNIIKNPSFEEVENNKVLNWNLYKEVEISSYSYSGKNSLHWRPTNYYIEISQEISIEKSFQYEMCAHIKLNNIKNVIPQGLFLAISSNNRTIGVDEFFLSKRITGTTDWKKVCYITGIIKNPNNSSSRYYFSLFSMDHNETDADIFVDDVSVRRINFRIAINNDREEVYDDINVVYQINGEEIYNLNDFELITRIKDNNKIYKIKLKLLLSFLLKK